MTHSTGGTHNGANGHLHNVEGSLRGYAHEAVKGMRGAAEYVRQRDLATIKHDLADRIRERPLTTIAVGFAVGLLLGRLLK